MSTETAMDSRSEYSACLSEVDSRSSIDFQFLLTEAIRILNVLGGQFSRDSERLQSLRTRLEKGRFHLAVLGQFKCGKSTLLKAFLGGKRSAGCPLLGLDFGERDLIRFFYSRDIAPFFV